MLYNLHYISVHTLSIMNFQTQEELPTYEEFLKLYKAHDEGYHRYLEEHLNLQCPCDDCLDELPQEERDEWRDYWDGWKDFFITITKNLGNYEPPPNSPTNQEMHAINGNHAQAHSLVEPRHTHHLLRSIRTAASRVPNPLRTTARAIRDRFPRETPLHSYLRGTTLAGDAGDLRFAAMMNQPVGMLAGGGYAAAQEAIGAVKEAASHYKHSDITNKEAHSSNGNIEKVVKQQKRPTKPWPKQTTWDGILPESKQVDNSSELLSHLQHGDNPAEVSMGPTNQEMHAYNGNPSMGPKTKAQHEKAQRRKIRKAKKKAEKKGYVKAKVKFQTKKRTIAKSMSKGIKGAAKVEKREETVARKYSAFLKNPVYPPPRLGSTGVNPTKLVHGFLKKSYNMSSISSGFTTVANPTYITAQLNPYLFKRAPSATYSLFKGPVYVGFAQNNTTSPSDNTASASFDVLSFANEISLKNEVLGTTSLDVSNPQARFLGGSVTMECRCPMTTTAPPFLYGGLLPSQGAASAGSTGTVVSANPALVYADAIRTLPSTDDVPGFSVSSVYQPTSTTDLEFNTRMVDYSSTINLTNGCIPYVGMVNCPNAAIVTITVSAWFEVQQVYSAVASTAYTSGWALGPRISTEDVFDHLKPFESLSTKIIGMGSKAAVSLSNAMLMAALLPPPPKVKTLEDEVKELKEQLSHLKLQIDEEEDEKYFDIESTPNLDKQDDTSSYRGLSRSTIDLAINLKKSLTPGSVTNKTVQSNPQ